jgi:uncharacterized protein YgbK (DUF1537 family)
LKIINTNSRNDPPEAARAKISEALRCLSNDRRELTYKKIDSTLRGHLGIEIRAAMGARGLAVVAPAFPAMGRLIRNGYLHVTGAAPPRPINLIALLQRQSGAEVIHIKGSFVARGVEALRKRLEESSKHAPSMVAMDTACQEDLAVIARAAWALQEPPLMVGSAALAAEVAKLLARQHRRRPEAITPAPTSGRLRGPVALIVGSTQDVSLRQCDYLLAHRPTASLSIEGDYVRKACRALETKRHILINISWSTSRAGAGRDEKRLASLAGILMDPRVRGIVLTGGDTANLVVRAFEASGIILAREILPGIPWGRLVGGPADGKPIATKAGGFGRPDALARVADYLARLET